MQWQGIKLRKNKSFFKVNGTKTHRYTYAYELREGDLFGQADVLHSCKVSGPLKSIIIHDGFLRSPSWCGGELRCSWCGPITCSAGFDVSFDRIF